MWLLYMNREKFSSTPIFAIVSLSSLRMWFRIRNHHSVCVCVYVSMFQSCAYSVLKSNRAIHFNAFDSMCERRLRTQTMRRSIECFYYVRRSHACHNVRSIARGTDCDDDAIDDAICVAIDQRIFCATRAHWLPFIPTSTGPMCVCMCESDIGKMEKCLVMSRVYTMDFARLQSKS